MRTEGRVGCLKALVGTGGIIGAVIGGSVLSVLALFALVLPFSLDGCNINLDLAPARLGVSGTAAGPIVVRVPTCVESTAGVVQLVGPDRSILWRAEANPGVALDEFTVGVAPTGFVDTMPLAVPIDPAGTYTVQLLIGATTETTASTTPDSTLASILVQLGGGQAEFLPASLVPDRILVGTDLVAPDDFDTAACEDEDDD